MISFTKILSVLALTVTVMATAPSAEAWDGHRDGYRDGYHHRHGHSHAFFGISIGAYPYYESYYRPYYAPPVVYAPPAPQVIYSSPVAAAPAPIEASDYCREYNTRVRTAAGWRTAYGTACLQPDGQWRVMN